jgi:AraC family transcriptional regulator
MNEASAFAGVAWGTGTKAADRGALGTETGGIRGAEGLSALRISHLVRRALLVLESDCQGARRCLSDALVLLGPQSEERIREDPVERGVFQSGGLARWQARRAVTYIDTHLESRLEVTMLAKLVSFSKSHFSRAFKQSLGLPPMTYVKMRRIERAKTLMTSTNQQLTQIALICGFADQSHLNRSFRKVNGVSPGRWRRSNVHTAPASSTASASLPATGGCAASNDSRLREQAVC